MTPTQWKCPGCALTIETTAVAVGHQCPDRRGEWTDLSPMESTDQGNGRTDHDRTLTP